MLEIDTNTTWNCCAKVDKDNEIEEKWGGEILVERADVVATCDLVWWVNVAWGKLK